MKVQVAYIFPNLKLSVYEPMAKRFVRSYMQFPPGETYHQLTVLVNGVHLTSRQEKLFDPLPVTFHEHNNYGKDIGGFFSVAAASTADMLVCLGTPVHCCRAGWLDRMVNAYISHGPGLYGVWGFDQPQPHIRTTVFWLPPALLAGYPYPLDNNHRYQFEHGSRTSLLQWTLKCGFPVYQVTWRETRDHKNFVHVPAEDCLVLDQHTQRNGLG